MFDGTSVLEGERVARGACEAGDTLFGIRLNSRSEPDVSDCDVELHWDCGLDGSIDSDEEFVTRLGEVGLFLGEAEEAVGSTMIGFAPDPATAITARHESKGPILLVCVGSLRSNDQCYRGKWLEIIGQGTAARLCLLSLADDIKSIPLPPCCLSASQPRQPNSKRSRFWGMMHDWMIFPCSEQKIAEIMQVCIIPCTNSRLHCPDVRHYPSQLLTSANFASNTRLDAELIDLQLFSNSKGLKAT